MQPIIRSASVSFTIRTIAPIALAMFAGLAVAGPINPPAGPVTSTMKTLSEVEPRIAINATNTPGDADATPSVFKITQPGTYYLTGNFTVPAGRIGIEIAANNVTIDMNGATMTGATGSLHGVMLAASIYSNTTIRNGNIEKMGGDGINLRTNTGTPRNTTLENINVTFCVGDGVDMYSGIVRDCNFAKNTGRGLLADAPDFDTIVDRCTAGDNTGGGIHVYRGSILNSAASYNSGTSLFVLRGLIKDCTVRDGQDGVSVQNGSVIGCHIHNCSGDSIEAYIGSSVIGNSISATTVGTGINAIVLPSNATGVRVEGNNISNMDRGVRAFSAGNLIIGNTFSQVNTAMFVAAGNRVGTLLTGTSSGAILGNSGGGLGTTDPHANIIY